MKRGLIEKNCSVVGLTPNRCSLGGYSYGFQNQEEDDEIKGSGNSIDFGARIYDPRIGRWLSLDPFMAKYPSHSPYNFALNNPILFVDVDGRDVYPALTSETKYSAVFNVLKETETYKQLTERFLGAQNGLLLVTYIQEYAGNTIPTRTGFEESGAGAKSKAGFQKMMNNQEGAVITLKTTWDFDDKWKKSGEYQSSQSYLASVVIHELIHANIEILFEDISNPQKLEESFPGISKTIENYGGDVTRGSHEYMATDNMRNLIANGLKEFDKKQSTPLQEDRYYNALAWGGLHKTDAFAEYQKNNPEEAEYVLSVLKTEQNPPVKPE